MSLFWFNSAKTPSFPITTKYFATFRHLFGSEFTTFRQKDMHFIYDYPHIPNNGSANVGADFNRTGRKGTGESGERTVQSGSLNGSRSMNGRSKT